MNEDGMWNSLKPHLISLGLDPVRLEHNPSASIPDVNYIPGMIELKYREAWPQRANTPVSLPKLRERPGQVAWLLRRWMSGGPAWLMVRVDGELFLFAAPDVPAVRDGLPRFEFRERAVWASPIRRMAVDGLKAWLTWDEELMAMHERARFLRLRCGWSVERAASELGYLQDEITERERPGRPQLSSDLIEQYVC